MLFLSPSWPFPHPSLKLHPSRLVRLRGKELDCLLSTVIASRHAVVRRHGQSNANVVRVPDRSTIGDAGESAARLCPTGVVVSAAAADLIIIVDSSRVYHLGSPSRSEHVCHS